MRFLRIAFVSAAAFAGTHGEVAAQEAADLGLRGFLNDDGAAALDLSSESSPLIAVFVSGATVYDTRELAALYTDALGRPADMATLVQLAEQITARYREDGYFLSRAVVPQNGLDGGLARVVVYEGYIASVRFDGDVPESARALMSPLTAQRPLSLHDLEWRLGRLRATPGLRVEAAELEPDLDDPAAHVLVLRLRQDRAGMRIDVNNRGSEDYGGWRATATGSVYGAITPGDRLRVRVLTAVGEPRESRAFELGYMQPVGNAGLTLETEIGAGRTIRDDGETRDVQSASMRIAAPRQLDTQMDLWTFAEASVFRTERQTSGATTEDEHLFSIALGVEGRWRNDWGVTTWIGQGLLGGARASSDALQSNPEAEGLYARVNLSLQHRARLGALQVVGRTALQLSDAPLPRAQQMSVGGVAFGRAYLPGVLRGDSGAAASIEVRYPALTERDGLISAVEAYAYLDGALLFDGNVGSATQQDLASAGGGVRVRVRDQLFVELEAAHPFADINDDSDWRQNVAIRLGF